MFSSAQNLFLMKKISCFFLKLLLFYSFSYASSQAAVTILFLGDSLTEGHGIPSNKAYPQLVKKRFKKDLGKKINILNLGVSGSTTSSGLSRLKWILSQKKIDIMVIALGANDGLRGVPLKKSRANLEQIIRYGLKKNLRIILVGMKIPPNYGEEYRLGFEKIFLEMAKIPKVKFIPFLLKDVAGIKKLNLPDGIHPNEKGHQIVAKTVFDFLKEFVP
jgi:acyl-CoA thioesterase-1